MEASSSSSFDFDRVLAYALSCVKQEGSSLKDQQVEAVKLLSEGKDVFMWFPTGYGKSICYQVLPFIFEVKLGRTNAPLVDRSVVLVISPLVSLMIDQVRSLKRSNALLSLPGRSASWAWLLNSFLYLLFCMAAVLQQTLQQTSWEAILSTVVDRKDWWYTNITFHVINPYFHWTLQLLYGMFYCWIYDHNRHAHIQSIPGCIFLPLLY